MTCALSLTGGSGPEKRTAVKREASGHLEASTFAGTLMGLQYEPYFTKLNVGWETGQETGIEGLVKGTQEAIPILGRYSSYDVNLIRKHEEWFEYLGIDWLLIDWTNFLWMKPAWEQHQGATHEIEETTELLFKTYSQLEKKGKHPPKLVLMLGFQNGPSVPNALQRLNGVVAWAKTELLDKPEYENQWLYYHGKPLLTILYTASLPCEELAQNTNGLAAPGWTVRWMGSQLQDSHVDKCGYWSWMDGTIRQAVTFRDNVPEETVVTPACFPFPFTEDVAGKGGWLDPKATGRDHGAPYIESWKVAFASRPKFIQIHQWNEFAGQAKGKGGGPKHNIFGDEYSAALSDDIEPTQLNGCGYRGCGGWGYYYMNLTKSLISLYRKETPDITVMALSGPFLRAAVKKSQLTLTWTYLGESPSSYTLKVDGQPVAEEIRGNNYNLDLSKLSAGTHIVQLVANGVHTYFDLAAEHLTKKSNTPLPVTSVVEFGYSPSPKR